MSQDSPSSYAQLSSSSQKRAFSQVSQQVTPSPTLDIQAAASADSCCRQRHADLETEPKKPKALFADDYILEESIHSCSSEGQQTTSLSQQQQEQASCASCSNLSATQPFDFTPLSQVDEPSVTSFFLVRANTQEYIPLPIDDDDHGTTATSAVLLGRNEDCDICVTHQAVGRKHATLTWDPMAAAFFIAAYNPYKPVYVWNGKRYEPSTTSQERRRQLQVGESFRLLPACAPPNDCKEVQFTLGMHQTMGNEIMPGSGSFDHAYLKLLRRIKHAGVEQVNKKGPNWTLSDSYSLAIELQSDDSKSLLPLSTLRKISFMSCLVEALWYLRGEDNIAFLQRNGCPYWNAQAREGFIGFNYGLLTNFPGKGNQLEANVIQPLCNGKSSRNMVCSLVSAEATLQEACTTSIQFSRDADLLNLTVNQRSSDVILGLPNDVVVWSIILHLVSREVKLRSGLALSAGTLYFNIAAGGAHVYSENELNFDELLRRVPIDNVQPFLLAGSTMNVATIDQLAAQYDRKSNDFGLKLVGYENDQHHAAMKITQAT